jgi:hypothetical protein
MAIFKGFKPQGMHKIANKMGYQGGMENFDNYLQQNPDKKREMIVYEDAAKKMARGGVVRMQEGGTPSLLEEFGGPEILTTPGFPSDGSQGNLGNTYVDGVLVPNEGDQSLAGGQVQPRQLSQSYVPQQGSLAGKTIGDVSADRLDAPALPEGATVSPVGTEITEDQLIDQELQGK